MNLLASLFAPRRIALIGASSDPQHLTARAQTYLRRHGFSGTLYLVNARHRTVLGEQAFASLGDLPEPVDFAYVLLPTALVPQAIAQCAAARVGVAAILAGGFADAGPAGAAAQQELLAIARAGGVRLLGPNSMGMINVSASIACSVNATLAAESLPSGGLSLISHSGGMMGALLSRAAARGIGFTKLIATGNEADLAAGEIADLLVDDPETQAILLFLETIRDADRLALAARRAHAANKPLIAYKLGRSEAGRRLAVTHTGAMVGSDVAADAFFRACGIIRVDFLESLFEIPSLATRGPPSCTSRAVSVVTTTGGGGAMVVDRLGLAGVRVVAMHDTTLAGAGKEGMAEAIAHAANCDGADLTLAVVGSSAQFIPQLAVAGVIAAAGQKPVVAFVTPEAGGSLRMLADGGVTAFRTPESCADGIRAWLDWRAPRARPPARDLSDAASLLSGAGDEAGARALFAALGLPNGATAIDPDTPPALRYPVALKAIGAGFAHKTELGAVALNIADPVALAAAAAAMRRRLGERISGFLVQSMACGVAEALLGFQQDPSVGPLVAIGAGGVHAEIYRDIAVHPAPVSVAEAEELIARVKGLVLARGYRGGPKGDLAALARATALFSQLAGLPEVTEAEINPLIVMAEGEGVVVADALLKLR